MPQRSKTRKPDFSQRVITALMNLAELSLSTSTLRFASSNTLNQLATTLIQRLVVLCDAQQGALFLTRYAPEQEAETLQSVFIHQPTFSLLASAQMSVKEARATLATYPLTTAPLQWSVNLPPTLLWRRSLDLSGASFPHPETTVSPLAAPSPHSSALLLFAWPEAAEQVQEKPLRDRDAAMKLLPFLGDVVDTILFHLLMTLGEREPYGELLPAELLATVGHEFRGPLTTISGYATTLLLHDRQFAPEERQDFLRAISEASTHLGKLVEQFLELAQFETNASPFIPASVDLAALVQEAITAARKTRPHPLILTPPLPNPLLSEARAEETSTSSSDALTVAGDRRWLRTMLDILLENAGVYSPQGSLIEVSIERSDPAHLRATLNTLPEPDTHVELILPGAFEENEALLEIRVRDHGRGIEPAHLARIFQRFYRVDTRLTREVNGLGLGLALCKAIVARHRGMLWVESMVEAGSTFHILLPRGATNDERERDMIQHL